MAAQLPKSVLSILTGETWYLNGSCRDSFIRFNEDGTGLVSPQSNLDYFMSLTPIDAIPDLVY